MILLLKIKKNISNNFKIVKYILKIISNVLTICYTNVKIKNINNVLLHFFYMIYEK